MSNFTSGFNEMINKLNKAKQNTSIAIDNAQSNVFTRFFTL